MQCSNQTLICSSNIDRNKSFVLCNVHDVFSRALQTPAYRSYTIGHDKIHHFNSLVRSEKIGDFEEGSQNGLNDWVPRDD